MENTKTQIRKIRLARAEMLLLGIELSLLVFGVGLSARYFLMADHSSTTFVSIITIAVSSAIELIRRVVGQIARATPNDTKLRDSGGTA